jgi:hypothetical protein
MLQTLITKAEQGRVKICIKFQCGSLETGNCMKKVELTNYDMLCQYMDLKTKKKKKKKKNQQITWHHEDMVQ